MSNLTPHQQVKLEAIQDSAAGIESTANFINNMFEEGRIEIVDQTLNERYIDGLLRGQIALAHLINQSLEQLGLNHDGGLL